MTKYILGFILVILAFSLQSIPSLATEHYNYEHAEEMRLSGRVEWRDYGPEAFDESIQENKPIFLLLTAPTWCYWCHVYTSDDYIYHPDIYPVLNEKFIPVYVDADKRQDLTRKFLEGGWPSTTVLTPGRDRLYGYSGPRPVENMKANLESAYNYVQTIGFSNQVSYNYKESAPVVPTVSQLNNLINGYAGFIQQTYDAVNGGFGTGQKFPQGRALDFSLEMYELTGNPQWLDLVQNTLQNQYTDVDEIETNYNLFDPVEGGFHRYGTQRDWTPPHFEKMLYDNARLLKTYQHLLQITPEDAKAKEVVGKTIEFMKENWFDADKGGFYGNSDVNGEEDYFGKVNRPLPKARVEKTKYSDWNTDAILAYLYFEETTNNSTFKKMSAKSLDFFASEMITEEGAYHYQSSAGEKGVRGSILDNAYLTLAFIEGYEVLGDEKYLEAAQRLADYSLEKLYDWNSGGFFERNSPDKELYARGEQIDLTKPVQENGVAAYAMLKVYQHTGNPAYLNAGVKTLGAMLGSVPGHDRGYYYVKASQLIIRDNLLADFSKHSQKIAEIESGNVTSFWLNGLITEQPTSDEQQEFKISDKGIDKLEAPILLLVLVALLAGFISFASPCTLPILPAYIAYSFQSSKHSIKGMTVAFFLGLSIVFTLLGMTATAIGSFLSDSTSLFSQIAGLFIILFGIYILLGKGFAGFKVQKKRPTSYIGALAFGVALGVSWTPCVGPILVALLLLASTAGSAATGGLLLFTYAVGLAAPLILVSTYLSRKKGSRLWKLIEGKEFKIRIGNKSFHLHTNSVISGLIFIILGYLMFSGILFAFNQYIVATGFQKWIFMLEDFLLSFVN